MPDRSGDIADLSAVELLGLYRRKRLSPVEATRAVLDRIAATDPAVNAFCLVDADAALAAAGASEQRWMSGRPCGLVDGVPASIKDLVLTRGWPTLRGSLTISPDQRWDEDAPVTARLREAGAILIGKTTTPEFGWKGVTDSPRTGITRNPWDPTKTPGGSSGGAAVAAALGMGALHVGTDGGGSVRIPAGFTGIVGFKPSFGRVPLYPASPFGTLSHVGPMTRSVADAALMLTVIARPDARDWYALPDDGHDYRIGLEDGVARLRVAFSPALGCVEVDPEVAALVEAAAAAFAELGADVEAVDPGFERPLEMFRRHWYVGAASLLQGFSPEQRALMDPGLQEIATEGAGCDVLDYQRAVLARAALGQRMKLFHQDYDLLLTPTLPIPAFAAGEEVADPTRQDRWMDWTAFSYPFNLTQQPACTVPCGLTSAGLPAGLQIVGAPHADALVLRAARAFEAARPFALPPPPKADDAAAKRARQ
jgi:aspartyl-tRNA(Asn)/glutamyl-tRNA(Gln) amidotransferase subunit A